MASFAGPVDRSRKIVSEHEGRIVYDEGDTFVKVFLDAREHEEELENLRKLEGAGVAVPEILDSKCLSIVTRTMDARPLDELVAHDWKELSRASTSSGATRRHPQRPSKRGKMLSRSSRRRITVTFRTRIPVVA